MPWKCNCVSRVCSFSRIVVSRGVEGEEVADHLLENEPLKPPEIEQAELQGLFDGGKERGGRIGAFQLEQATQGADAAAMGSLLEGGGIAFETGMMASQELFFQHRTAALAHRGGMMLGHGVTCIALVDQ